MAKAQSPESLSVEEGGASGPAPQVADPWGWCLLLSAIFAALTSIRPTTPSIPFFDEVHYLPAARDMITVLEGGEAIYRNREHPLLGKTLIAAGMAVFGDNPLGWRIMSLIAGTLTVGASMRAMWHASNNRFATAAFGVL